MNMKQKKKNNIENILSLLTITVGKALQQKTKQETLSKMQHIIAVEL